MSLSDVGVTMGTCFGSMAIGFVVARSKLLDDAARKGVAALYAKLVFPMMVFKGVAAIELGKIDPNMVAVILLAKLIVAVAAFGFGYLTLTRSLGRVATAHAAAYSMASSHSFDVTAGVPLAKLLYPALVDYVYLNQTVQLVIVNPVLLALMELGKSADGKLADKLRSALAGVARNPLVVMTLLGLLAGQVCPAGLPRLLASLSTQVANAGPFLGFLSLGFACASLGSTSPLELRHCLVLAALKLALMPAAYSVAGGVLGSRVPAAFLSFLGSLPASASVYSLALVAGLSPRVLGPLVPLTLLASTGLAVAPVVAHPAAAPAAAALRGGLALVGAASAALSLRAAPAAAPATADAAAARKGRAKSPARGKKAD